VDTKKEISEFLTSRRARITPAQAGLPAHDGRRVPGLRRAEVAVLAGVSVPYYTRLERGDTSGVSDSVLDALARALQLDDAERVHLFDLARGVQPTAARPRRRQSKQPIRADIQWTLDAITGAAALAGNERLDILAANSLGHALFSDLLTEPDRPANHARYVFLDRAPRRFYGDWDRAAAETVAILRWAAGRDPTTATSPTSSVSSPPRARRFAPCGPRTTSGSTPPPSNTSTTPPSGTSASASTAWTSPPTTG